MLRLGLLLILREAVGSVLPRDKHPLNQCASSKSASHRFFSLKSDYPSGIKVTSTVTTKTVKPPPASPKREQDRRGQAQDSAAFKTDIAAMMRNMFKSSLLQ